MPTVTHASPNRYPNASVSPGRVDRLAELEQLRDWVDAEIAREQLFLRRAGELKQTVRRLAAESQPAVVPDRLIAAVADAFGVAPTDVIGPGRDEVVVKARLVVVWALRQEGLSLPKIGRILGGRDHTTVLYAERQAKKAPELQKLAAILTRNSLRSVA